MRACGKKAGKRLTSDVKLELLWAQEFLALSHPRLLRSHMSDRKLILFTDAAVPDDDLVAFWVVGGVVQDKYYFASAVPHAVMDAFQGLSKRAIAGFAS